MEANITVMNSTTIFPEIIPGEAITMMFKWFDYCVFGGMLTVSVLIGLYFGFFSKQDTAEEYLLGGKTMTVMPIALSLVASYISGLTILGMPADVYTYGASYMLTCVSNILATIFLGYVLLPMYYKLELTSSYEYMKLRFDNRIRVFASILYIVYMLLFIPVVIYIPALALSQATGINKHLITPILCIICIFYTSIGGIKAVVWTDSVQMVLMVASTIVVFFLGLSSAGGLVAVLHKAAESDRLDIFDFNTDPTQRGSFWTIVVGTTVLNIFHTGINQGQVQRIMAVPNIQVAKRAILLFGIGVVFLISTSIFTGLIIYAIYSGCDPITTGQVERHDQMLPHYVIDVSANVPGLPGIFIAGLFSASLRYLRGEVGLQRVGVELSHSELFRRRFFRYQFTLICSTLSTTLNTVSGLFYQDIICSVFKVEHTEKRASSIMKIIVVILGLICTLLVFVVEKLGGVIQLSTSVAAIAAAPTVGLFFMGMFFPFANSKGALYGGITGIIFTCWIILGSQYYSAMGMLVYPTKPVSTQECQFFTNFTSTDPDIIMSNAEDQKELFILYRISFFYYTLMGIFVTMITGLPISWFTCKNDPPVHRDLICPIVHSLMSNQEKLDRTEYITVERSLHIMTEISEKEMESVR